MTEIKVNNSTYQVDADDDTPLLWLIRDHLNLNGTKFGCGAGLCGSCTIHLDGIAVRSCQLSLADLNNRSITTIEGIKPETDQLHPMQQAWLELDVPQCGYCQSGQIMSAIALLQRIPAPSDQDIDRAMSGNICRCGTYTLIRTAIKKVASEKPTLNKSL